MRERTVAVAANVLVLVAAVASALPAAAQPWAGPAALGIEVKAEGSGPVPGVELRLKPMAIATRETPRPAQTGADGRAIVGGLAGGLWQVDLVKQGYAATQLYVRLEENKKAVLVGAPTRDADGTPFQVDFFKVKRGEATLPPPPAPGPPGAPAAKPAPPSPPPTVQAPPPAIPPAPKAEEPGRANEVEAPPAPVAKPVPPASAPPPAAAPTQPSVKPPQAPVAAPQAPPAAAPAPTPPPAKPPQAPVAAPQAPPVAAPAPTQPPAKPPQAPAAAPQAPPVAAPAPTQPPAKPPQAPAAAPQAPPVAAPVPAPAQPPAPPPPAAVAPPPDPVAPPVAPQEVLSMVRSASAGNCADCKKGEAAVTVEQLAGPATSACAEGAAAAAKAAAAALTGEIYPGALLQGGPAAAAAALAPFAAAGAPCQLVAAVLPAGARYTGYLYEAGDEWASGGCNGDQPCEIGSAAWNGHPAIEKAPGGATLVWALFTNGSPERARRARLTVYFSTTAK